MECARRISGRSIRWHQPCDALGNWVKVRDRAKEIAEDRWPVNARGVGFCLVSQAGVKVVAWTKEILESLPMLSISRVGWRKLWKITPKHHGEDKAIVNKEKQIIANRSKLCRQKRLGSKPESNFRKRISLFITLFEKLPKLWNQNWLCLRQVYKQIYQHNFCFLFVRNKMWYFTPMGLVSVAWFDNYDISLRVFRAIVRDQDYWPLRVGLT